MKDKIITCREINPETFELTIYLAAFAIKSAICSPESRVDIPILTLHLIPKCLIAALSFFKGAIP